MAVTSDPIATRGHNDSKFDALDAQAREWAGVIAAATAQLIGVISEVDRADDALRYGFRSLEHWVTLRCGVSAAHARRLVAISRSLADLPAVTARFTDGAIGEDHLVEIARAGVSGFHDDQAAELAAVLSVSQLRTSLSFLPDPDPEPDPEPDPAADRDADPAPESGAAPGSEPDQAPAAAQEPDGGDTREWVRYGPEGPDAWGMHVRLSALHGAIAERALHASIDHLYRERHGHDPDPADPPTSVTITDALIHLLSTSLDLADPATRTGHPPSERYLVNVHLHPNGAANLHLGAGLTRPTRDELCCDTTVRAWLPMPDGSIGLGRRARVVTPRLRLAIEHRDGGCVVPGCHRTTHLHIHHITHWLHGGPTDTHNLVALCPQHHTQVHHGRLQIAGNPDTGTLQIANRHGRPYTTGHPTPPGTDDLTARRDGAHRSPWRAGEPCDWRCVIWREPPPAPRTGPRSRPPDRTDPADTPHAAGPPQPRTQLGSRRRRARERDDDVQVLYDSPSTVDDDQPDLTTLYRLASPSATYDPTRLDQLADRYIDRHFGRGHGDTGNTATATADADAGRDDAGDTDNAGDDADAGRDDAGAS